MNVFQEFFSEPAGLESRVKLQRTLQALGYISSSQREDNPASEDTSVIASQAQYPFWFALFISEILSCTYCVENESWTLNEKLQVLLWESQPSSHSVTELARPFFCICIGIIYLFLRNNKI